MPQTTNPAQEIGERMFGPSFVFDEPTSSTRVSRNVAVQANVSKSSKNAENQADLPPAKKNPKDVVPKRLSYQTVVKQILDHDTSNKTGVRFHVQWEGSRIIDKQRSPYIIEKGGSDVLRTYLEDLQVRNRKRFTHLIERQEDLAELMTE